MQNGKINTKKNSIIEFFKYFDAFGANANFNIDGSQNSKSLLGGITYFIFFLVSLAYVFYNFYKFASRQNNSLIFAQKLQDPSPKINLTQENFLFGISIADDNSIVNKDFIDRHFDLDFKLIEISNNQKKTIYINKTFCKDNDFEGIYTDKKKLPDYYCPDKNHTRLLNYTIEGTYQNFLFKYLEISISLKKESISKAKYISQYIENSNIKISALIKDTLIDYENVDTPILYHHYSFAGYLEIEKYKRSEVKISKIEFSDDQNIIMPYEETNNYFTFKDMRDYSDRRLSEKPKLFAIYINSSPNFYVYKRTYQKLPEFLADMTGILSQSLLIMWFIIAPINEKHLAQMVLNKVMKYGKLNIEKINYNKYSISSFSQLKKNDDIKSNNDMSELRIVNKNCDSARKENHENINQESNDSDRTFLNSCDLIIARFFCCFMNNKKKKAFSLILKTEEKISFYLNILLYIRKLQEIDIIKYLILDNDQTNLFNFLAGPSVMTKEYSDGIYKNFMHQQKEIDIKLDNKKINELIYSFDNICKIQPVPDMSRKLLSLFVCEIDNLKNQE